jgi:hypothetical protein
MFNLDHAITDWRRQMLAAGIKSAEVLDELESHLREDIEQQMRSGVVAKTAFENARQRIGQAGALGEEFGKIDFLMRRRNIKSALLKFLGIPIAAPLVFTPGARDSLDSGRQAALGFHHDFIGTEHVLLGLLATENSIVPKVLRNMDVSSEVVRNEIENIVGHGPQREVIHELPYTPRVKKALEFASQEARALGCSCVINPEHIFLGLILEGGGVAALVLKKLGVDAAKAREQTLRELASRKDQDA